MCKDWHPYSRVLFGKYRYHPFIEHRRVNALFYKINRNLLKSDDSSNLHLPEILTSCFKIQWNLEPNSLEVSGFSNIQPIAYLALLWVIFGFFTWFTDVSSQQHKGCSFTDRTARETLDSILITINSCVILTDYLNILAEKEEYIGFNIQLSIAHVAEFWFDSSTAFRRPYENLSDRSIYSARQIKRLRFQ